MALLPFSFDSFVSFDWLHLLPAGLDLRARSPTDIRDVRDTWRARDGTSVTLRATREDDAGLLQELVRGLSLRSRYHRFFYALHELAPDMLHRFTHNDAHGALNLVALIQRDGRDVPVAMAQYVVTDHPSRAEFAVVVADEWQRGGLGRKLVETLSCIARAAGITSMQGDVLAENEAMVRMMVKMGFELELHPDDATLYRAMKVLQAPEGKCSPLTALAFNLERDMANANT